MTWAAEQAATTLALGASTNLQAVQNPGNTGDWVISLNPGEIAHVMIKSNLPGTTDDVTVYVWASNLDSPGSVPDSGTSGQAGTDWDEYQTLLLDNGTDDDEWKEIIVSGVKKIAFSAAASGTTDSPSVYVKVAKDSVDAQ